MEHRESLAEQLKPFLPEESLSIAVEWIATYKIFLTITQKRSSILGDYRRPENGKGHRISINGDLNRYAFLITLVHEVAHLTTWSKHYDTVSSHGREWKQEFKLLMDEFSGKRIFPGDIRSALKKYLVNPSATHCDDPHLMKVLNSYNKQASLHLEDLAADSVFEWANKQFRKGEKIRKRYRCVELATSRTYIFSPVAEVKHLK